MQALRDLIWVVNSQSLLHPMAGGYKRVDTQEIDAHHLNAFMREQSDHRVGRYFERLVHYWLRHVREVQIVHESQQIRVGNRTVGEIDFIFRDESGRLTHWETAVKFFLYDQHADSFESQFIGPNSSDNFEKKTAKMFSSQLPLSETHFPEVEIREAFVKGRIFYPPNQQQPTVLPKHLAPEHLAGTWIRAAELDWIDQSRDSIFRVQRKPLWLTAAPVSSTDYKSKTDQKTLSSSALIDQLESHFTNDGHPVLISRHDQGQQPVWIFVVPDHWPKQNPNTLN